MAQFDLNCTGFKFSGLCHEVLKQFDLFWEGVTSVGSQKIKNCEDFCFLAPYLYATVLLKCWPKQVSDKKCVVLGVRRGGDGQLWCLLNFEIRHYSHQIFKTKGCF